MYNKLFGVRLMNSFRTLYQLTKNLNILYIEDDTSFLKETTEVFQELFNTVDTASNGEEGLNQYLLFFENYSKHYDIVVTDINMPKMDGIELIKKIYEINPKQIIIVISAHNEPQYLLELVNMGIEQFLLKPNNYDTILNIFYRSTQKLLQMNQHEEETLHVMLEHNIYWDKQSNTLWQNNVVIKLTKNETLLMKMFIKNKTKITTIQEIFHILWQDDPNLASTKTLKSIISRLRKKLPDTTIENVYSLGYRLIY